jgi:hypothetical protein
VSVLGCDSLQSSYFEAALHSPLYVGLTALTSSVIQAEQHTNRETAVRTTMPSDPIC